MNFAPLGVAKIGPVQQRILFSAQAKRIGMEYLGQMFRVANGVLASNENPDGHALLDVEHIFVLAAVRGCFLFLAAAM